MESELGRVVDALPGLVWTALPDGRIDFLNRRWCEYTGLLLEEALDRGWRQAVHPEDLPELLERWQSVLASGDPGEMETRLRRHDGEYRWFHVRASPLADTSGRVVRWCGVNTDIEDLRRATDEARRAHAGSFRTIADSIPALIALMTPTGEVESVNRHVLEYFGTTLDGLKGWAVDDTLHPDDLPAVAAAWRRSIETGEPYDIEHRMRRADGAYRWFHVRGLPLRDADGRIVRWYVLQTDIDQRKQAETLLAGEKEFLEMVARGLPMPDILEALCRLVESTAGGSFCSVVLVDAAGTRLEHGAAPSLPAGFIASIVGRSIDVDSGPCAMAACLNQQVISTDLASETRWAAHAWCPMALSHGLRACWATPILSANGAVLGAFALYFDQPGAPTPFHLRIIEQFAHIASIAIERVRSDAALRHSEARKKAILDSALDGIVTIDHESRITEFNPAAEGTFGYRREEVMGRELADVVIPPSLREGHRRGLARHVAAGAGELGRRVETTAMRADGSEFPVELTMTRISLEGPPSFTGYLRDITERKRSEESFRAIVETTPECVKVVARDGTLLRVNSAGAAMVGAESADAILGQSFYDVLAPEDRERYREFNERICSGEKGFLEYDIVGLQGVRRQMETHSASMRNHDGTVVQLGVTRDITARKQAEERLRRSEAYLAEAQKLSLTGSFGWSVATDEHFWSDETFRIFGYDAATRITLQSILDRVHPQDVQVMKQATALAEEGRDFDYECRLSMEDGSVKHVHIVGHGTRGRHDQLEYIGAVQDVTERRLSEEALGKVRAELAHVSRVTSLGALTASITHEVSQPLSGIITNASTCVRMLAADPPNIEGARETARRTIRDGNRASDVITRLRALFARKDAVREAFDLNEATREVIALTMSELKRNRMMLRTEFADGLPAVIGDRIQLQQVVLNLLMNAADAMSGVDDRPRKLVVTTEQDEGDCVRLIVKDSGVGLEPGDMDRLFDAFYTTKHSGMGIGLSVSRSIIENHDGRLWATPNDGPGATFSFSIPHGSGGAAGAGRGPGAMRVSVAADAAHAMRAPQ